MIIIIIMIKSIIMIIMKIRKTKIIANQEKWIERKDLHCYEIIIRF